MADAEGEGSKPVGIDHFPDSYWLGRNEEPMIAMLDFLEGGGAVEDLPDQPAKKTEKVLGAGKNA